MRSVHRRHELIQVLVSDPGEFSLPRAGIVTVRDLETGEIVQFDASHVATRQAYTEHRTAAYEAIKAQFRGAGMDCIEISTAGSTPEALTRYFRLRERRRR